MKKFTDSINEKQNHYSGDQKLYNEIYNLIEETLSPKMDGEDSERVSLIGKENLVNELSKIVQNEMSKTKIQVLESFKATPNMITEKIESKNELLDLVNEAYALGAIKPDLDMDAIMVSLKESGWGDLSPERFEEFENTDHFNENFNEEQYTNAFDEWLNGVSNGSVQE